MAPLAGLVVAVALRALLANKFGPKEKRPTILAMTSRRASPPRRSLLCVMREGGRPGIVSITTGSTTSFLWPPGIEIGGVSFTPEGMRDGGSGVGGLKVVLIGVRGVCGGIMEG